MAKSPFEQIGAMLARLTIAQKATLVVAILLTGAGIWGIVELANRVRYEVLFSNLEPEDASTIVAKLQESKIPYRIDTGGGAISVPSERVAETRLSLAGEGRPRGGVSGVEIFDRSTFDVSDFVQNVNYQRAMERELARTIEALDAVSKARVHLVLPGRTLFADEKQEAKASVVLKLYRGRQLRSEESLAIANLVASATRGLTPDKVSIVDTDGRMLKDGQGDDSERSLSAHQLELKASFEHEMQGKLITLLTPIVGEGKVRTRVEANLDFQKVQRVEEKYDAEGAVVRSEQKGSQKRSSGTMGGAPGTPSNLPPGAAAPEVASAPTADVNESTDSTVNYEIPKTVATIVEPVGGVKKLSVAVVVDNTVKHAKGTDGKESTESVARPEEEMKKLTDLVKAAIGFDEKRGDVLTVENLPFDTGNIEEQKQALGNAEKREFYFTIAKWPSLVLGALLIFLFVVRPLFRGLKAMLAPRPGQAGAAAGEEALLTAGADTPTLVLRKRLIEISASEPEGAAQVVRGWLRERNG